MYNVIYLQKQFRKRTSDPREEVSDYNDTYGNESNDKHNLPKIRNSEVEIFTPAYKND